MEQLPKVKTDEVMKDIQLEGEDREQVANFIYTAWDVLKNEGSQHYDSAADGFKNLIDSMTREDLMRTQVALGHVQQRLGEVDPITNRKGFEEFLKEKGLKAVLETPDEETRTERFYGFHGDMTVRAQALADYVDKRLKTLRKYSRALPAKTHRYTKKKTPGIVAGRSYI